jgi:hypothetical protein
MRPVQTKADMYQRLAAGEFGNTIPQYFSCRDWLNRSDDETYPAWGVRTLKPGGPCRLNCPPGEVVATACQYQAAGYDINISMMVDTVTTIKAWLEIVDLSPNPMGLWSETLSVEGIEWPDTCNGATWRNSMPNPLLRRQWNGKAARLVLERHLRRDSLTAIDRLLLGYPQHVIELSALDKCLGTLPNQNHVIWEVRAY